MRDHVLEAARVVVIEQAIEALAVNRQESVQAEAAIQRAHAHQLRKPVLHAPVAKTRVEARLDDREPHRAAIGAAQRAARERIAAPHALPVAEERVRQPIQEAVVHHGAGRRMRRNAGPGGIEWHEFTQQFEEAAFEFADAGLSGNRIQVEQHEDERPPGRAARVDAVEVVAPMRLRGPRGFVQHDRGGHVAQRVDVPPDIRRVPHTPLLRPLRGRSCAQPRSADYSERLFWRAVAPGRAATPSI
jgi:hypothetical protein